MPLPSEDLEPLLRLALVEGVGPHRLALLIEHYGAASEVLAASSASLTRISGIGPQLAARIRGANSGRSRAETERAIRLLDRLGAVALTVDDPAYPSAFLDIPDRPYILYAAGNLDLARAPAVAVVGTRSPTPYGRAAATRLSRDLALAGFAIVSGLARGIDSAAHEGALAAGGYTIGVLGHGIEQVYPPESRGLYRRVRSNGLILTEYPPGETPKPGNFPRRNRLITALSRAVLVVEMALKSGAQHTVTYALAQGKEVMAVPGPIGSTSSEGTNQLIRDGAPIVTSAADVIEELYGVGEERVPGGLMISSSAETPIRRDEHPSLPLVTPLERRVLDTIASDSSSVDEVAAASGMDTGEVLVVLLDLELRGLVQARAGMRYSRIDS